MATTETNENPAVVDESLNDSFNRVNLGQQADLEGVPKTDEEYAQSMLTLRAIVSSKEAGVIIGKAGKNVADLREETGVKAGVSKVVQGVHDRVLTVTGPLQGAAKAYAIVAKGLLEGAPQLGMGGIVANNGTHRKWTVTRFHSSIDMQIITIFEYELIRVQLFVFSSLIIRWEPLSDARVSRSSISKMYPECAWWHRRRCYLSQLSELLKSRGPQKVSRRLSGKSESV